MTRGPDVRGDESRPRLFFAVPLPERARNAVAEIAERVRARNGAVRARWVRFDGLHLTLQFLGPTPTSAVPALEAALADVAGRAASFEVALHGAGAFPDAGRPRTLWVGLTAGAERLTELAEALAREPRVVPWIPVHPSGGPPGGRKPFAPHLTIARTDGVRGANDLARALEAEAATLEARFTADRVVLYRSILGRGPARYESLADAAFGG